MKSRSSPPSQSCISAPRSAVTTTRSSTVASPLLLPHYFLLHQCKTENGSKRLDKDTHHQKTAVFCQLASLCPDRQFCSTTSLHRGRTSPLLCLCRQSAQHPTPRSFLSPFMLGRRHSVSPLLPCAKRLLALHQSLDSQDSPIFRRSKS